MAETVIPIPGPQTIVLSLTDITAIGPPGPQGGQGIQGVQGPVGPPGPPLTMKGTVPSKTNLPASGNHVGDLWVAADTGHGWSWSGTAWVDTGPFQGPQGAQGAQGAQGPVGPGSTVTAGPTTTGSPGTSANVVNTGTPTAAVFAFTIPQGIAGPTGATGATGPQGPQGPSGPGSGDMLKAVYDTNNNGVVDSCDSLVYSKLTGVPSSFTPSAHATTHITGGSDVIAPASSSAAGLLKQLSGNTTDFVDGTNNCQNLVAAVQPTIWSARLRSFNALGNPTFEVDQRSAGATIANPASNVPVIDRWIPRKVGTMVLSYGQQAAAANEVLVPGTNFAISSKFLRMTLTTQEASLAAGDSQYLYQFPEGPRFRELQYDVHSVSLLVRSSVAGLKFSFFICDNPATKSLVHLCTIPSAATWTLITIPSIPVFPAGNFSSAPGVTGYFTGICLACGTTGIAAATDTWQVGSFQGAPGMDNFASKAVGATFDIAYAGDEPGALCTMPQDCSFGINYDGDMGCLRYFQKSYPYGVAPGTVNSAGIANFYNFTGGATNVVNIPIRFPKIMAKAPTVTGYSNATGAINNIRDATSAADRAIGAANVVGDSGFSGFTISSGAAPPINYQFHYTADTGW
jgi:hypothetical protein